MLSFICPHCQQSLKINPEHLGLRGKCNKCGGKIALIGRADAMRPQMASRIAHEPEGTARPATPRQVEAALRLGATSAQVASMNRDSAGDVFQELRTQRAESEPPTARQLEYLKQLGLPTARLEAINSKADASQLIDQWLPPPTQNQRDYLARLGATVDQIAVLRTRAQATELIQRLLSGT